MTPEYISKTVNRIIADQFAMPVDQLHPETDFDIDLHADSLDYVELLMELEDEFEVTISDEQVKDVRTLQNVYDLIWELTC